MTPPPAGTIPHKARLPLAVTMGDPAGIGPDIILKAFAHRQDLSLAPFAVFGDPAVFSARAKKLGIAAPINTIEAAHRPPGIDPPPDVLTIVPVTCPHEVVPGNPDTANGYAVISAIEQATAAVVNDLCSAIVTAPISKASVYECGFGYPGHTEFLAALAERHYPGHRYSSVMMIASDVLKVVPLTIHVPLAAVPALITTELLIATITTLHTALKADFGVASPRIAIAGLNPHAGEQGTIGSEERDTIEPALTQLRQQGLNLLGPLSGDTLFHAAARRNYDAVVTMYHDQALIPIKTLSFDTGVNVTLGLPFMRTSPDHGTAFGIAGTGSASATSFVAALRLAHQLALNRSHN